MSAVDDLLALKGDVGDQSWIDALPEAVPLPSAEDDVLAVFLKRLARHLGGPGSGNFGHMGRPGEIGGSGEGGPSAAFRQEVGTTADEMRTELPSKSLAQAEDRIRREPNEHGLLVREDGTQQYYGNNQSDHIKFPETDKGFVGTEKDPFYDGVFTHNHPSNGALSPDDVFFASVHNMKEMRAVTRDGTYSLKRVGPWPDPNYLVKAAEIESDKVKGLFLTRIASHTMTNADANRDHWKTVWTTIQSRLQREHGAQISFTFEPKR